MNNQVTYSFFISNEFTTIFKKKIPKFVTLVIFRNLEKKYKNVRKIEIMNMSSLDEFI